MATDRALVIGGGGSAGNAWAIGVIAGLTAGGVDATDVDVIIGTSAGSTVAAQVTAAQARQLYEQIVAVDGMPTQATGARTDRQPVARPAESPGGRAPRGRNPMAVTADIIAASTDGDDMRRRMAAAALAMDDEWDADAHEQRRAVVAARLPQQAWPQRDIRIVAVDARTGESVIFDRDSGVDLVDAVAASCASVGGAPAHRIGAGRYIDGGYRSVNNVDLAADYGHILVISPLGFRSRVPDVWGIHLAAQVEAMRRLGRRVDVITPDADAQEAFGVNIMDPSTRPPAARAGFQQGEAAAPLR